MGEIFEKLLVQEHYTLSHTHTTHRKCSLSVLWSRQGLSPSGKVKGHRMEPVVTLMTSGKADSLYKSTPMSDTHKCLHSLVQPAGLCVFVCEDTVLALK